MAKIKCNSILNEWNWRNSRYCGDPYIDGDGVTYLPMSQQPIMIYSASEEELKDILKKALTRDRLTKGLNLYE